MNSTTQIPVSSKGNEDIYLFKLINNRGTEVHITNYGAIITSFKLKQPDGSFNDIVLGFDDPSDYWRADYLADYPYFGAVIGRYANRIKEGRFTIDGDTYQLATNKGSDHLHGGENGFDKKVWKLVSFDEGPHPSLVLQYTSPDGEEGYPGELITTIRFDLADEDELSYEITAIANQSTAVNIAHHSYFNLHNGEGTVADHEVRIDARSVLEQDDNFVVTGQLLPVAGTAYDLQSFTVTGSKWNPEEGYDQTFVLEPHDETIPVAEARSGKTGLTLQVFTSEPVVHFYTGKWIPAIKGKNEYAPYSGLCFETQVHPNAINIPSFPATILRPGETYRTRTRYKVISGG